MPGRRSHSRITLASPWVGEMRVLREVIVERLDAGELIALSPSPGLIGEQLCVHLLGEGTSRFFNTVVAESSPVIVDGCVQYRIRLTVAQTDAAVLLNDQSAPQDPSCRTGTDDGTT